MRKLLVVVDMQNDFVSGPLGTKEAQQIVPGIAAFIESFDGEVIFTRDTHYNKKILWDEDTDSYVDSYFNTQEGKRLPVEHCIENTPGWEIVPQLKPEHTLNKITFGSTALGEIVAAEKFDEIHFVGVCTGICVISNAVIAKAFDPEARIVVHKDLCACVTPQSHETAINALRTLQMDVV